MAPFKWNLFKYTFSVSKKITHTQGILSFLSLSLSLGASRLAVEAPPGIREEKKTSGTHGILYTVFKKKKKKIGSFC